MIAYIKKVARALARRIRWVYSALIHYRKKSFLPAGTPIKALSNTQRMFVKWNAERLHISSDESLKRYSESWKLIRNGHRGDEFRAYCSLTYGLFRIFFDDNEAEAFDSYTFHGFLDFLRMLSYPDGQFANDNFIVQKVIDYSQITVLDFGCGLANQSRIFAQFMLSKSIQTDLVLVDIPTMRKDFLLWLGRQNGIKTTFLDCTANNPIPELPRCDICFATEFFEHVHDPESYLLRIHGALNPKGILITNISDHESEFMHVSPDLKKLRDLMRQLSFEELRPNAVFRKLVS